MKLNFTVQHTADLGPDRVGVQLQAVVEKDSALPENTSSSINLVLSEKAAHELGALPRKKFIVTIEEV